MKKTKQEKGITLVALVITIIVLLILSVVTINAIQGSGTIDYSQNATNIYAKKVQEEKDILKEYISYMDGNQVSGANSNFTNMLNDENCERGTGYIASTGEIVSDDESIFIRVPVNEGEKWCVWYEDEANLGMLRYENASKAKVGQTNMQYELIQYRINSESDSLGAVMTIPVGYGVSYICITLKMSDDYDYTESAIITKLNSTVNWVAFGDSITEFNYTASNNYVKQASEELSIPVTNLGLGGTGYLKNNGFSQFFSRIPSDVNFVTVYGSFNDLGVENLTIGSATDTYVEGNDNSLAACMNYTLGYIQNNYPDAKIAVIAPSPWSSHNPEDESSQWSLASEYVSVLKEICEAREIPCLDLFTNSEMTPWETGYNSQYYYNSDGTHPNNEGHKIIAPQIISFLRKVLNDN